MRGTPSPPSAFGAHPERAFRGGHLTHCSGHLAATCLCHSAFWAAVNRRAATSRTRLSSSRTFRVPPRHCTPPLPRALPHCMLYRENMHTRTSTPHTHTCYSWLSSSMKDMFLRLFQDRVAGREGPWEAPACACRSRALPPPHSTPPPPALPTHCPTLHFSLLSEDKRTRRVGWA